MPAMRSIVLGLRIALTPGESRTVSIFAGSPTCDLASVNFLSNDSPQPLNCVRLLDTDGLRKHVELWSFAAPSTHTNRLKLGLTRVGWNPSVAPPGLAALF